MFIVVGHPAAWVEITRDRVAPIYIYISPQHYPNGCSLPYCAHSLIAIMVDIVDEICREKPLQKPQMSQASLQRRQKQQQRNRRGNTLIKKAYELCDITDADIFLGIRFRDGRVKTFCADKTGFWSSKMSHLVLLYTDANRSSELIAEIGFILSHSRTQSAQ
jgi:hypothetical protein